MISRGSVSCTAECSAQDDTYGKRDKKRDSVVVFPRDDIQLNEHGVTLSSKGSIVITRVETQQMQLHQCGQVPILAHDQQEDPVC